MLTQARLKEVLSYDPETGVFVWLKRLSAKIPAIGCVAGSLGLGYRRICIDGKRYLAHRLAWFYVTGEWPKHEVDHINDQRDDNRFANLQDIRAAENQQKVKRNPCRNKTTGFVGVRHHVNGKFRATIRANRKCFNVGVFDTAEAASEAYWEAKRNLHHKALSAIRAPLVEA